MSTTLQTVIKTMEYVHLTYKGFLAVFSFLHQPYTKKCFNKNKIHVCSSTNRTAVPKRLKMAPTILPTIASNALTAFPASLLSASASLFNQLIKVPSSFGGKPPTLPPPPKTPVMGSTIAEMVIERAVRTEKIVVPSSQNKVRIFYAKDKFLLRTFSRVCLVLSTCV